MAFSAVAELDLWSVEEGVGLFALTGDDVEGAQRFGLGDLDGDGCHPAVVVEPLVVAAVRSRHGRASWRVL